MDEIDWPQVAAVAGYSLCLLLVLWGLATREVGLVVVGLVLFVFVLVITSAVN